MTPRRAGPFLAAQVSPPPIKRATDRGLSVPPSSRSSPTPTSCFVVSGQRPTRPDRNLHVIYSDSLECFAVLRITMSGVERQMGPEPIAAKYGSAKLKSGREANKRIRLVSAVQSFVSATKRMPRQTAAIRNVWCSSPRFRMQISL